MVLTRICGRSPTSREESRNKIVWIVNKGERITVELSPILVWCNFQKGHNITSDNYFTYLDLCLRLAKQGCSLVDTIRSNRGEIPNNLQETCSLHDTTIVKLADAAVATVTITKYQCKKSKSVNILSSLHRNVAIPSENNPKKKLETVLFYNETKVAVDVLDQMSRCYSVKVGSRRWPIHVFYNVIDMALINSWIIYKHVCNSSIRRRIFIQRVSEELTGALQTKGYKLKAMQLLQSVLQHLKNAKLVVEKAAETEQQIFA